MYMREGKRRSSVVHLHATKGVHPPALPLCYNAEWHAAEGCWGEDRYINIVRPVITLNYTQITLHKYNCSQN